MSDDLYGLQARWKMTQSAYRGNTLVSTDTGRYVCSAPHEVAKRIVSDHQAALVAQGRETRLVAALVPIMAFLEATVQSADASSNWPDDLPRSDKLQTVNDTWLRRSDIAALQAALADERPASGEG